MEKRSDMSWALHKKMNNAPNLIKYLNEAKQTIFRIFPNSERNLVMHFQKTKYRFILKFD